jgi:caa(3)-type oxidase subunit IV
MDEQHEMQVDPPPTHRPNYIAVFLALTILTAFEVAVTYLHGLPKPPVLLGMAFIKIMLVVLYFMHLKEDNPWYRVVFFLPFLLVVPLMIIAITQ